jgi:phenylpropionate dioxygenase-like ring-hydroxylating dioxygenase large terminal subunit
MRAGHGTIQKRAYVDPAYVALEKQRLWPRVWQMACRLEELPEIGSYVTYDVADESVIVVRTGRDRVRAYHNVCRHRGRRLTDGCGRAERFRCRFHGWEWAIDGSNAHVTDREDWEGALDGEDLSLRSVNADTWGGWVFVNLDRDCEPLREYLEPAAAILDPFELGGMRFRWRKWLRMPCNWKVALEAFNEGYHVRTTHRQVLRWSDDPSRSEAYGKHAMFGYPEPAAVFGTGSVRLGNQVEDTRQAMADFYAYLKVALDSNMTDTLLSAARSLLAELPAGTSPEKVLVELNRRAIERDAARGVRWPEISPEQYMRAGTDWHIFPNMILLPMATNCLGYRARPWGDDPDACIFEVYQLERFPEGRAPRVENLRNDDLGDEAFWGEILLQDFQNMEAVQRGMKSSGFGGPRTNPRQETSLRNFHRVYHEYLSREDPR